MSKKKVTAPLSYEPGRGRPKEFLAYLNWQEMQALQRLNGGNMEFGPRGLPSFPPADSIGSNQTPGTGNWGGAPGGNSVGSPAGGDVGGTTESGNISGGATQTSSTASTTASSATSAASQNTTDASAQQTAAIRDANSATKSSALVEDARRSGIGSINVGPMQTPVKIGEGRISQAVKSPEVTLSMTEDFYRNDPYYKSSLNDLRSQAEARRASVVARDSERIARESAAYDFMTDDQKKSLVDKYSISGIASAASNLASYVYNNPLDAAKGVVESAISPAVIAGQYLLGDRPMLNERGDITEEAASNLINAALSYGVGTGVASFAAPRPANSVGAFLSARISPAPEVQRAAKYAESVIDKYTPGSLTPEQVESIKREIYDKTAGMVSTDVSGVQYMQPSKAWSKVDPFGTPTVEVAQTYVPKVSGISSPQKYGDVFKPDAINYFMPQVEELNMVSDPTALKRGNVGYFNPDAIKDPYTGITGAVREYYDMMRGASGVIPGPGVSINSFDPSVLGRLEQGLTPENIAKHEIGVHAANYYSGGMYGTRVAGPDYYQGLIESKNPSVSRQTAQSLGRNMYEDALEEQAARKMEARNYNDQLWRDYQNRFSNFSPEEISAAEFSRILRDYYDVD